MNWEAIGAVGEVAGAIAVVLTLVYLSRQIRHSTNVSKVSSYHEAVGQIVESAKDPDFSRLQYKFSIDEPLSPEEEVKANVLATLFIYGHEILLRLYQQDQVDKILWDNIMDNNLSYLVGDMMLPVLRARPGRLSRDLLLIVEEKMDEIQVLQSDV